jgi:GMP synthase (glutamine-hydrolysing)
MSDLETKSREAAADPARGHETIVVLDFGSQFAMLIARRVRELSTYCEFLPWDAPPERLDDMDVRGIILSGGPNSVYEPGAPHAPQWVWDSGLPVLGICYGMQLWRTSSEARSSRNANTAPRGQREQGPATQGLPGEFDIWMSRRPLGRGPTGFHVLRGSGTRPVMADLQRGYYGLQFHPEVAHTPRGKDILRNFVQDVCGCPGTWTSRNFIEETVENIRAQVGEDGHVICGLSGGVDSSVAAALIHKAIGDRLTCIFVDNGLLRAGEAEEVVSTFRKHMRINLDHVEAEEEFLAQLAEVTNPETKRIRIGTRSCASSSVRPAKSRVRTSSRRVPSTPTSSRARPTARAPRRSRLTTMSAASRRK